MRRTGQFEGSAIQVGGGWSKGVDKKTDVYGHKFFSKKKSGETVHGNCKMLWWAKIELGPCPEGKLQACCGHKTEGKKMSKSYRNANIKITRHFGAREIDRHTT